jgi:hypothetical protein
MNVFNILSVAYLSGLCDAGVPGGIDDDDDDDVMTNRMPRWWCQGWDGINRLCERHVTH